ncbi:hypothetical protein AGMMS49587_11170 [Spirochaetia bacterium]|nr:hypothetical protein AGMMS49587_11170 [Spirochaetia bacterium]
MAISALRNFPDSKNILSFSEMDSYGNHSCIIGSDEITRTVTMLSKQFNLVHSSQFFDEQKNTLLHTVIDRFALGGIMAQGDKIGGNVDTVHNVRNGVYATEQEKKRYDERDPYDPDEYHKDKRYIEKNRQGKAAQEKGELEDGYTGEKAAPNQKMDLDHTNSAKSIHDDPGRVLAEKDGAELANSDTNLNHTDRAINRSKKQKSAEDFANELDRTRTERRSRIAELSSRNDLTEKEQKELALLQKKEQVDTDKMRKKDQEARREYEKKINQYYYSKKFIFNLGKQSLRQGAIMGLRQIVGVFLTEAIAAVFDEIRDACNRARSLTGSLLTDLKYRLKRILARVAAKWRDALHGGLTGAISGFFSNIITVIINIFVTTAKNIVRIIREGFFSIMRAVKLLLNPPAEISKSRLYHEAGKIIITGTVVTLGILAEETIDKFPPMLVIRSIPLIGELIADIVYGIMVALVSCFALWGWDKLDLFGAKEDDRHQFVMEDLHTQRKAQDAVYTGWLERIRKQEPERYETLKPFFTC